MATAMKNTRPVQQGGRFRVLTGEHLGVGPEGCECEACLISGGKNHRYRAMVYRGNEAYNPYQLDEWKAKGGDKRHHPQPIGPDNPYDGDIIETDKDLVQIFNVGSGPKFAGSFKFERVDEHGDRVNRFTDPAPPPQSYPLEKMNLAQLIAVAADEKIETKGFTKKEDLISAIELGREQSARK